MAAQSWKRGPAEKAVETTQPIVVLARGNADEDEDEDENKGNCKGRGGTQMGRGKEEEGEAEGREGFEGDGWEEGEVERGMLHALVELGHLEMLLHQVRVILCGDPTSPRLSRFGRSLLFAFAWL